MISTVKSLIDNNCLIKYQDATKHDFYRQVSYVQQSHCYLHLSQLKDLDEQVKTYQLQIKRISSERDNLQQQVLELNNEKVEYDIQLREAEDMIQSLQTQVRELEYTNLLQNIDQVYV